MRAYQGSDSGAASTSKYLKGSTEGYRRVHSKNLKKKFRQETRQEIELAVTGLILEAQADCYDFMTDFYIFDALALLDSSSDPYDFSYLEPEDNYVDGVSDDDFFNALYGCADYWEEDHYHIDLGLAWMAGADDAQLVKQKDLT